MKAIPNLLLQSFKNISKDEIDPQGNLTAWQYKAKHFLKHEKTTHDS